MFIETQEISRHSNSIEAYAKRINIILEGFSFYNFKSFHIFKTFLFIIEAYFAWNPCMKVYHVLSLNFIVKFWNLMVIFWVKEYKEHDGNVDWQIILDVWKAAPNQNGNWAEIEARNDRLISLRFRLFLYFHIHR